MSISTKGEPDRNENSPANTKPLTSAQPSERRLLKNAPALEIRRLRRSAFGSGFLSDSGNSSRVAANSSIPKLPRKTKIACQPKWLIRNPPIIGATSGAMLIVSVM